ncbi:GNAT family N-acetyltransferase [Salinispora fenicalii]|uniref:GNAT family N-acetyltransferase n=1 Tax=Salinispora fenicalii TaxID=1137263 RepID=UPI0004B3795F|nr:GNAT family N-acetyltransferase [Salinispora fenicalii]
MTQATLRTARLQLVPLSDDHLEGEVQLDADPEVMRYLGRPRQRAEVEQAHRRRIVVASAVPGLGFWAGLMEGSFVGWWILQPPERADQGPVEGQAELGYRLLRRYWRQGLASEGARELIRHGFADLGLHRIFAETMAVNLPSRTTMAAVGLDYVRTFHLDFDDPLPGSEHGEVEYATTRQEWLANRTDVVPQPPPGKHAADRAERAVPRASVGRQNRRS